jgi:hypothetical protein
MAPRNIFFAAATGHAAITAVVRSGAISLLLLSGCAAQSDTAWQCGGKGLDPSSLQFFTCMTEDSAPAASHEPHGLYFITPELNAADGR